MDKQEALRRLPRVDDLTALVKKEGGNLSQAVILRCCRRALDKLRFDIMSGKTEQAPLLDDIVLNVLQEAKLFNNYSLKPVINATGVVLHTNLGRAVLCSEAVENVKRIAASYSTLEYDVENGERGSRHSHIESLICELTGAEAAMAVNNNAAAVMLTLMTLCKNKEVVVSRGELVEIGGSFRIPEIMALSGAVLKEVGTTNKTRLTDYASAINQNTSALLKVHTSNFKIVGFSEEADIAQLKQLAAAHNIPLIYDLGSGMMFDTVAAMDSCLQSGEKQPPLRLAEMIGENTVTESIKNGADVVCFSGDKLFGGPQAGIIAGRKQYIDEIKRNQFARVVRIDKLNLAALEATLKVYSDPLKTAQIPTLFNISVLQDELKRKANKLKRMLTLNNADIKDNAKAVGFDKLNIDAYGKAGSDAEKSNMLPYNATVRQSQGQVGGGSAPAEDLLSFVVEITSAKKSAMQIEGELRRYQIPIIARISKGGVFLDVRTIKEDDFGIVTAAVKSIFLEKQSKTAF